MLSDLDVVVAVTVLVVLVLVLATDQFAILATEDAAIVLAIVDAVESTDQYKGEKGWEPVKWL